MKKSSLYTLLLAITLLVFGIFIYLFLSNKPDSNVHKQDICTDRNLTYSLRLLKLNTNTLLTSIEKSLVENENRKDLYLKAMTITNGASELRKYVDHIRAELIMHAEAMPEAMADTVQVSNLKHFSDYTVPTHFLIGADPYNLTGEAVNLRKKLEDYLTLINTTNNKQFPITLLTAGKPGNATEPISWEVANFYHISMSGCLVIFKSLQLQIMGLEENQLIDILNQMQEINTQAVPSGHKPSKAK